MFTLPPRLAWIGQSTEGQRWLRDLPGRIRACADRWSLRLGQPYEGSNVSVVIPATMADGTSAVLKVQFPGRESQHEAEALRRWGGRGAVRLFDNDSAGHALLIERCEPGDHLSTAEAEEAIEVLAVLLPRLWVDVGEPFTSLREEAAGWAAQLPAAWERAGRPFEKEMLDAALQALDAIGETQGQPVLLHQDLHGDNVLRATREPWLVIDPKPLVGEREFSVAPIVRAYEFGHSRKCAIDRLEKLVGMLGLNRERARLWAFTQTLAWAFEGEHVLERHIETARWLWQA